MHIIYMHVAAYFLINLIPSIIKFWSVFIFFCDKVARRTTTRNVTTVAADQTAAAGQAVTVEDIMV